MAADSVVDLADWDLRSKDFGRLREYDDGRPIVAAEYAPYDQALGDELWSRLRDLWLDLSPHPHVVDALERGEGRSVVLRYAALDWNYPMVQLDVGVHVRERLASWGVQLTDAFRSILGQCSPEDASRFRRPSVRIDLGGAARIAFLPVEPTSGCDERVLVQVIGKVLRRMCARLDVGDAREIKAVLDRSLAPDVEARYPTLDDLHEAWRGLSGSAAVRAGEPLASWMLAEEAVGWIALRSPARAIERFEHALELDPGSRVAGAGLRCVLDMIRVGGSTTSWISTREPEAPVQIVWAEAEEQGLQLEAQRAFREALVIYQRAQLDGTSDGFVYTARARCYLALGMGAQAVDGAQRALAVRPAHLEALSIRTRGYLVDHAYERALACATSWLASDDHDASAHYSKGRALLGLARYAEARDAFDRAIALRPQMIEAILLGREADRAAARVREAVGTQPKLELSLPEHLGGVRDALANGRLDEVIAALGRPEYETDADATLVRAQCLAFIGSLGEAIASFDRAGTMSARHRRAAAIGKAHALLGVHRAEDALALFDQVSAQHRGDLEALEGRTRALRLLGRQAEAEASQARYVAASGGRSDLRVDSVKP